MRLLLGNLCRQDIEAALRVGLSVGLPLGMVHTIDRLDLAVYAAFGALTSLYGHGEASSRRSETQAVAAAAIVPTVVMAAAFAAVHGALWLLGVLLVALVIAVGTLGAVMKWVPRGEIFFVLVLMVLAQIPIAWTKVPLVVAVAAGSAGLSVLLSVLWGAADGWATPRLDEVRHRVALGLASLDRREHCIVILAAAAGVLSAWLLAIVLGIGHPFWAPVIVAALMPALAWAEVYRRMVHLVLGTLAGVGAAAVLFSWNPDHLQLIAIVVLCQAAAELFVARQHGVALLFISPLAIDMSNLGRGLPWQPLLIDRLAEAAFGTAIAFVVILAGRRILARIGYSGAPHWPGRLVADCEREIAFDGFRSLDRYDGPMQRVVAGRQRQRCRRALSPGAP
jgi:Fusaric acid resistance protein-like